MAAALRRGECPVDVAPAPLAPVEGWKHWHSHPELFIQLRGSSRFDTPEGDVPLRTGRALLMPPLFAHNEYVGDPRQPFANLVFHVSNRVLAFHLALAANDGHGRPRVAQPDLVELPDHQLGLACLLGLARAGSTDLEQRSAWMLAFCAWAAAAIETAPPPGQSGSERIRRTRELVLSRLASPVLSVVALGAWVGCHPDHLARLFRKETGQTIVGHIRSVRLARAREYLADPTLKVADVARLVGIPDAAYFSRIYRRAFGVAPMADRQALPGGIPG
jgi:AraC-like DNA-binding protein